MQPAYSFLYIGSYPRRWQDASPAHRALLLQVEPAETMTQRITNGYKARVPASRHQARDQSLYQAPDYMFWVQGAMNGT